MCDIDISRLKKLGEGEFGTIYDVDETHVLKVTKQQVNQDILEIASSRGIGPRVRRFQVCSNGDVRYVQEKLFQPFKPEFEPQLPELITRMFEAGIVHNDLHTENFMADKTGHLYLIDFDLAYKISEIGSKKFDMAVRSHSRYFDNKRDMNIPIEFTAQQLSRIQKMRPDMEYSKEETQSKLKLQRVREEQQRLAIERQKTAAAKFRN
jgi:tRNA A-37 threonylcarbamoyl transferase component Bud32